MTDLYTIKDLAGKTGLDFPTIERLLQENGIQPAERKGMLRFYSKDAVDLLETRAQK